MTESDISVVFSYKEQVKGPGIKTGSNRQSNQVWATRVIPPEIRALLLEENLLDIFNNKSSKMAP